MNQISMRRAKEIAHKAAEHSTGFATAESLSARFGIPKARAAALLEETQRVASDAALYAIGRTGVLDAEFARQRRFDREAAEAARAREAAIKRRLRLASGTA